MKEKSGLRCCVRQVYFTKSCRQGKQYHEALFFYHTDLGQKFLFFVLFKCLIVQFFFFTILQDKLYSFYIQDDRNTRFLCTRNYCIELTAWSLLRRCFIIRFVLFEDMGEREARERAADLFFIARARGVLRN